MNLEQCAVVSHLCPTCPHLPCLFSPPNVAAMSHVSSDTQHVFVYQLAAVALILGPRSVSSRPSSSSSSSSSSQIDDGSRTQHRPRTSGIVVNGNVEDRSGKLYFVLRVLESTINFSRAREDVLTSWIDGL
ncbi:unnamed protein product [Pleuronectes platessa]|uniref:Uncharacterized protein n=1 Tax=Pleuronectes platessa TaxID=8262 RepID=A0A9N7UUL4_PLEPL|nr:unnamed protein product [Pleuronectes platessa]